MLSAIDTSGKDLSWIDEDKYTLVTEPSQIKLLHEHISDSKRHPVLDLETEGLSHLIHKIAGIGISPEPKHAYYIPLRHKYFDNFPFLSYIADIKDLILKYQWITWNGIFEWKMLKADLNTSIKIHADVQSNCWLVDPDRGPDHNRSKLALDYVSKEVLGITQLRLEDLLPDKIKDFTLVEDPHDALFYAGGDVDCTNRLHDHFANLIEKLDLKPLSVLEAKVLKPSSKFEYNGIHLDVEHARSIDLEPELKSLQDSIDTLAGQHVNPASPQQVAALLFDNLGLRPPKEGDRTVDDHVLERLENVHPVVPLISNYRELDKLNGTFLKKLKQVAAEDGRLHCGHVPTGTRSGRFAHSRGIGLHGLPVKINVATLPTTERVNIRKVLSVPKNTHYWLSADFSQIEYRVLAYASGDQNLIQAYIDGTDFHEKTAALIYRIPVDKVTDHQRSRGKTINFAIVYGMTAGGLALALHVTQKEADQIMASYFKQMPKVSRLINDTKAFVTKYGHVLTEFGRRRNFDFRGCSPRQIESLLAAAFNTRIQGTAADINKLAIVKTDAAIEKTFTEEQVKLLSTIHDELNLQVRNDVPVGEMCQFMQEYLAVRPGLKPSWHGFPIATEVGPSYGELTTIHPDQYSTVKTLDDVRQLQDAQTSIKKAKASKDTNPDTRAHHANVIDIRQPKRRVSIVPPAVIISLGDNPKQEQLNLLNEVVTDSYGTYNLYLVAGQSYFYCDNSTVNPSPTFAQRVQQIGFSIQTLRPSGIPSFDPGAIVF